MRPGWAWEQLDFTATNFFFRNNIFIGTSNGANVTTEISLADVIRAVEGPIASVRGSRPEDVSYTGAAAALGEVWIELRSSMRGVLEQTSLAELVERSKRST